MIPPDVKNWLRHTPSAVQKKFTHGREGHWDRLPNVTAFRIQHGDTLHNPTVALSAYEFAVYTAYLQQDAGLGYVEESCRRAAEAAPLRFKEPGMAWVQAAKTAGAQSARMKELLVLDPDVKTRTEEQVYHETRSAQVRQTAERLTDAKAGDYMSLAITPEAQQRFKSAWDAQLWSKDPSIVHAYTFPTVASANTKTMGRFAAAIKPGAFIPLFTKGKHGQVTTEQQYQAAIAWGIIGAYDWEYRRQRLVAPDLRRATQLASSLATRLQAAGAEWYKPASSFMAALPGVVLLQQEGTYLFDPDVLESKSAGFALGAMLSSDDAFQSAIEWATRKCRDAPL